MQLILFLLRSPVFWLMVIVFWGSIHYYNKLVKAQVLTEESLLNIERLLKQRLGIIPKLSGSDIPINEQAERALKQLLQFQEYTPALPILEENLEQSAQDYYHISQQMNAYFHAISEPKEDKNKQAYNQNFEQFSQIEKKLTAEIEQYNKRTSDYNILVNSFPSGILAAMLNMDKKEMFV